MLTAFFAACFGAFSIVSWQSETPQHGGFRTLAGGAPDAGRRRVGGFRTLSFSLPCYCD